MPPKTLKTLAKIHLPLRHLSIRVPWHDSGWDGRVCQNPTANTSCLGSETNGSLRSTPNPGAAFNATTPGDDPVNHGPIIALVGQGAAPSNAASFRGFVALDIRNFQSQTPPSNVFYNGVTAGTNANTLKALEASWVATGYPGPNFPPVIAPKL